MNLNYSFFKVSDGHSLAYKKWDKVDSPIGVVILIHGMAEHIERYDSFARYLNDNGFIVYGTDQRGHGKTSGKKGLFSYDKGWKRVIADQKEFFDFVQKNHEGINISYVTHSMGSYVGRALVSIYDLPIERIIFSGTGYEPQLKTKMAIMLAGTLSKTKGPGTDANTIDKMVNGPFAQSVPNPTTTFDWLSRDHDEVAKYVNDSNCGFICSNKFYYDFFNIVSYVCKNSSIKKINKDMPILFYSGDHDPVGGKNATNVKKVHAIFTKLGMNASIQINVDGRHESLNETNQDEVYSAFLSFLKPMK